MAWWNRNRERLANVERELAETRAELAQVNNQSWSIGSGAQELRDLLGVSSSLAGPVVTPETATRASAVFACVRLIAGAIASLPLPILQRTEEGRERADHPVWWLLNEQPTPTMTAHSFWEWVIADRFLRGDGIAAIGRNAGGVVQEIMPLARRDVIIERKAGRLRYYVRTADGEVMGLDQDDVLHFPGFGFDGTQGMSVVRHGAQSIGLALATEEYSARFFSNGASPSVAIEVPGNISEEQSEQLKRSWMNRYSGLSNSHTPMILRNGAKAAHLSLNAEDAQLLQSRQFQVIDIARWFGVPPFMIGETDKTTSWGSGVEHMSIGFVRYTLGPHLSLIEQELNRKLWPRSTRYFAEFNVEGLLRGDSQAEAAYFREALGGAQGAGWMKVNEVRKIKNLPPVPDGDRVFMPSDSAGGGANEAA